MWFISAILDGRRARSDDDRAADQAALTGMARGDGTALAVLYDRRARGVYSLALRILQDASDAEDVVQEVFAQAWRQAARYDAGRGAVAAWLLTLTRSRAIDRLRARRSRAEGLATGPLPEVVDPAVLPDAQLASIEEVRRLREALASLPLLQRTALQLAYFEGMTHVEIAAQLQEPLGTVKTRIRSAMIKLRDALGGAA